MRSRRPTTRKAAGGVQAQAGDVLGEDAGLQGPEAGAFGGAHQFVQQGAAHTLSAGSGGHVDADLGHAAIDGTGGHGAERRPADDLAPLVARHQARLGQVALGPRAPSRAARSQRSPGRWRSPRGRCAPRPASPQGAGTRVLHSRPAPLVALTCSPSAIVMRILPGWLRARRRSCRTCPGRPARRAARNSTDTRRPG